MTNTQYQKLGRAAHLMTVLNEHAEKVEELKVDLENIFRSLGVADEQIPVKRVYGDLFPAFRFADIIKSLIIAAELKGGKQ